ncbi:ExeM/NucH family extracellular endonuclease [Terrabacter sp. MAHUQ-38]|uniref:ExeM/NucH family extracellular endonuclease n=1 Tax=unclassified Terrabacter TaxID=2630222 RepID=UPI00165D7A3B|nr:ExeM/NucH family extracellular endonuclease [Terrabacter sp. MAHUQ-38]MBC9823150.1 ExeM/NucH family extracellular endonuclease [Terrabacter sp. MAHUQ-38]
MRHSRPVLRRVAAVTTAALAVGVTPLVAAPPASAAAPAELFISEYVEGSSFNKAVEIYNGTGSSVDLGAAGYSLRYYSNGATTATNVPLTGTVASGDVFVLAHSSAASAVLAVTDQQNSGGLWNGDDAVALAKNGSNVDVLGQIGFDPGSEWGTGLVSTADNTLRRKPTVTAGDTDGANAFDPSVEWDGYATDTFDGLGSHAIETGPPTDAAPTVVSTAPTEGSSTVALGADVTVTFSEPVTAPASAFTLDCSVSGAKAFTVSNTGQSTYTVDPTADFAPGDACTLTLTGSAVSDVDATDPPDAMAADLVLHFATPAGNPCEAAITPIPAIQGSGATAAVTGTVTTRGVVVGDYEGAAPALRGFFLQDLAGDDNPATSDGIFVFEGSNANTVKLGDVVTVTGTAGENQGQTQVSVGTITVCGTGTVSPTDVTFPVASDTALERFEGMLVRLPQAMSVTEHFQLGRFGQVTLAQGGRLAQPTNVAAPGADAAAVQAANNLRKIVLDDASQFQNPDPIAFARGGQPLSASNTLRGGDTATGIVGVLNYTWGGNAASPNAYRIRPINALGGSVDFEPTNPRPTSPPAVGGDTRVVGMNLLNFFNTLDVSGVNCTGGVAGPPIDCRGANTATEFERQWRKTVAAVSGSGADVVAFMEMENDGYGTDSAERFLVDKLNDADGDGTWAFIDADARAGQVDALGNDAIKVGMLYKPRAVTPVGTTAVLNSVAFVNAGTDGPKNRPALAQAFRDNTTGGTFVAVANHLKSKGSGCGPGGAADDQGDGQGNCNGARTVSAQLLADWLDTDPTGTTDPDVLILGDLNSYAKEDPITTLEGAGFTNLIAEHGGDEAYSYAFDGQWGYLDHALGSDSLRGQVTGVGDWHINSDEPSVLDYNVEFKSAGQVAGLYAPDEFRISDHDPVVVGLDLTNADPAVGTVTGPSAAVSVGSPAGVNATFTDADPLDTHTASIAWGDGSSSTGTVTGSSVSGSHAYTAAGFYTLTVTVTDQWGHSDTGTTTVVVYDPAGGFVTGGGTISSPAGALRADPSHSGKGSFQLSVSYPSGGTEPTGSLTYDLAGTTFAVATTTFDWLVVSGTTATFAGPVTVNGATGYRGVVTATDTARRDAFRLVVTDGYGSVVYDSGTQTVRGQVVVH